jgi:hypothetical protein
MSETTEIRQASSPADGLILDSFMGDYDFTCVQHIVVNASTDTTYATARTLDFLSVRGPLINALMWMRGLPQRLSRTPAPPLPEHATLDDLADGDWVMLGENPGSEVAFGAVGMFWQPNIKWRRVDPADFTAFAEPGWGKIAANFSVRPYGLGRTLLTYEARTSLTDRQARRRFRWYWLTVSPFVAVVLRTTLRTIKREAERRPRRESPR